MSKTSWCLWLSVPVILLVSSSTKPTMLWPELESDEVQLTASHSDMILASSGLSSSNEQRMETFLERQKTVVLLNQSWQELNREWLSYARGFFGKVYPGQERFNQYVGLWLDRHEKLVEWRQHCRQRFFSDLSDKEILARSAWLFEQEEWQEMQKALREGTEMVERDYEKSLGALLQGHDHQFKRLHQLFVEEHLPGSLGPGAQFL